MRCVCCDRNLNDHESTRKSKATGEYLDMCNKCLDGLEIEYEARHDLSPGEIPDEDFPLESSFDTDGEDYD